MTDQSDKSKAVKQSAPRQRLGEMREPTEGPYAYANTGEKDNYWLVLKIWRTEDGKIVEPALSGFVDIDNFYDEDGNETAYWEILAEMRDGVDAEANAKLMASAGSQMEYDPNGHIARCREYVAEYLDESVWWGRSAIEAVLIDAIKYRKSLQANKGIARELP